MEKQKDKNLVSFGIHFRKLREELDLSQDDVAANSNKLTKATVSDIENGKRNFAFTTFIDLAKGIGKEPNELINLKFDLDKDA